MTGESSLLSAGVFCGCRLRSNEVRRSWSRRSIMAELDVPPALLPPVLLPPAAPQLSSPPTGSRRPPLALFICFSASSFLNDPLVVCTPTSPPVRAPRGGSGGAAGRGERERGPTVPVEGCRGTDLVPPVLVMDLVPPASGATHAASRSLSLIDSRYDFCSATEPTHSDAAAVRWARTRALVTLLLTRPTA
jgi:hypothetical protein